MKVFQIAVIALASVPNLASAAPAAPSDSSPKTAVLSFEPAWAKADQLEAYVKKGQGYIRANVPACLDIWYFWNGAKKDRMVIGERYTNQSALWEWVRSDEHTNIAKDLPGLIDIFSATLQTDISIDIKDLFG